MDDFVDPVPGECCDNPTMLKGRASYVCANCGLCGPPVYTQFQSFDYHYRKRSVHSRIRWFRNMVINYVRDHDNRELLTNDFQTLVRTYEKHNLLNGRNISIYGYYIIKLAERRGIPLTGTPDLLKTARARIEFDKRYKAAYEILGW